MEINNTTYNKRITPQTYTTWAAYTKWTAKIANTNTLGKQVETSEHDAKNTYTLFEQNPNSKYAQHILDTQHTYSNIHETMDILHFEKKGPLINTLEQFHIYTASRKKTYTLMTYTQTFTTLSSTP
jgi:hypothetical protein